MQHSIEGSECESEKDLFGYKEPNEDGFVAWDGYMENEFTPSSLEKHPLGIFICPYDSLLLKAVEKIAMDLKKSQVKLSSGFQLDHLSSIDRLVLALTPTDDCVRCGSDGFDGFDGSRSGLGPTGARKDSRPRHPSYLNPCVAIPTRPTNDRRVTS